jgi:hypothetical protein
MDMDGGTLEVIHNQPTATVVDDISRVLRWLDESMAENLRELARRQRQPWLKRTDLGIGVAIGMDMVKQKKLKQQQHHHHQSDYGTNEALQTWLYQQATKEVSLSKTYTGGRTISRWFQQVERYRHSFLQWYTNYSGQTARPPVAA